MDIRKTQALRDLLKDKSLLKEKCYIDGKWVKGNGRKGEDVLNPVTEKPLAHLPHASKADLDEVLRDSLTQNSVMETNAQSDPNALATQMGATSSINLRGLGSAQTLILINGQRAANFASACSIGSGPQPTSGAVRPCDSSNCVTNPFVPRLPSSDARWTSTPAARKSSTPAASAAVRTP